jgi:hypothetical protein
MAWFVGGIIALLVAWALFLVFVRAYLEHHDVTDDEIDCLYRTPPGLRTGASEEKREGWA